MSSKDQKTGFYQIWKNIPLWKKIMTAMVLGLATGFTMGPDAVMFKPLGDLFLNAIRMLIVPLVFCSLVSGVTSMNDSSKMGRVAIKSIALYLSTGAVAITIGLLIGNFFAPGEGMNLVASSTNAINDSPSMIETLVATIPANPIMSMANGEILQIIVFALFIGVAISGLGKKAEPIQKVIESGAEVMYQLTGVVMGFAPYGIFGLMAAVAGQNGLDVLLPLAKVIGSVYFGCAFLVYGLYSIILKINGLSPKKFIKATMNVQSVAFSTSSSSGALPVSLQTGEKKLGLSKSICSFILPLGATVNMNGTALYQGVCALFIAQAYGIELTMANYITIIFTSTLAAVGTAGVPGAGLIMLSLVLSSVGLPMEGVALIAAIDRILDMARTWVNVQGDVMVSTVIAKSEGELNQAIYDNDEAGEEEVLNPQVSMA